MAARGLGGLTGELRVEIQTGCNFRDSPLPPKSNPPVSSHGTPHNGLGGRYAAA